MGYKLNKEEWDELIVNTMNLWDNNKELRLGQSYMIELHKINPRIYNLVTSTNNDPFYDDKNISNFLKYIYV